MLARCTSSKRFKGWEEAENWRTVVAFCSAVKRVPALAIFGSLEQLEGWNKIL